MRLHCLGVHVEAISPHCMQHTCQWSRLILEFIIYERRLFSFVGLFPYRPFLEILVHRVYVPFKLFLNHVVILYFSILLSRFNNILII